MLFALWLLIALTTIINLGRACAAEHIWRLLVAPATHIDIGLGPWYGIFAVWGLLTFGLMRSADESALEEFKSESSDKQKWDLIRLYAMGLGRRAIATALVVVGVYAMAFVMGW